MSSPTKEESGSADKDLKNLESEAPNDCSTVTEPSSVNPNAMSEVETAPMNRELGTASSQEHRVPEVATNDESEIQKTEKDSQDLKEEPLLIQIPIPQKLIFFMSGVRELGRITDLSFPLGNNDNNNPLTDRARIHSRKIETKVSDLCYRTLSNKMPFQLSTILRIPFFSNQEIRRMILCLLCRRHFSEATRRQNTTWVKQKYAALLPRTNALTQGERAIVFGRPLRLYYQHPLIERIAVGKLFKPNDSKGKGGLHIFVRPVFYVPRPQIQNTFIRKVFEAHWRTLHNMRVVIIRINNGWKYLCPICGSSFNNLIEFREHYCNSPGN
ncbi:PREDICTED: CPX chromosomal region candidate gene 1 protein [Condylura cristata]|uniref:CPX chromosomal region candidate gene 1 protein n=1 Tax=Condylura cristata TaxID=143302 RepID=UPI000334512D|nr:PREDICTED: CPX chromosomal region candidate gene 1 protein [Condylura cristata]